MHMLIAMHMCTRLPIKNGQLHFLWKNYQNKVLPIEHYTVLLVIGVFLEIPVDIIINRPL